MEKANTHSPLNYTIAISWLMAGMTVLFLAVQGLVAALNIVFHFVRHH